MATTTTIGAMTIVSAANMAGTAVIEVEDSAGASAKSTLAILRTKVLAGSTGYTATDPLNAGAASVTTLTASGLVTASAGLSVTTNGITVVAGASAFGAAVSVAGDLTVTSGGRLRLDASGSIALLAASTTSAASLRVPHGTAPTSPADGDMWTTSVGLFVRINGVTVGPLS